MMQYCLLQHLNSYFHQIHPQLGIFSALSQTPSFLLSFFLCSSAAYWAPTNMGDFIFQCVISFAFFKLFIQFSGERMLKWFASFPSLLNHTLSELSTMTHLSWVSLHNITIVSLS